MLRWPEATIYGGVSAVATERPDAPAVRFEGETTTYGDLLWESRALAGGLAALGVEAGDVVAVWLGNRPEWIKAQLAASHLGAAIVAVNTRYRTHELEHVLCDSNARLLLTEREFLGTDYLGMLADLAPGVRGDSPAEFDPDAFPALREVVTLGEADGYPAARAYAAIEERGHGYDGAPAADNGAPACIFYTSGTTSDPKGCVHTSRSLLNHSHRVGVHLGVTDEDVALGALPFCGVWGYNAWLSALAHGASLVVGSHFDAERAVDLFCEHGVTYFSGLATMFLRMLDADGFDPARVATMERGTVGFISTGYDEAAFERIEEAFGFPVVQPYGLSEGQSQVFVGDPDDPETRRKRVGGPLVHPDAEAKVVDPETGQEREGEPGELCLRGYFLMAEYLGRPAETAEAIDEEGWLHTGDLATREGEYFYFHSRLDDALRVRGFLVAPREIEAVVDEHPGVDRSQVVGAPHPRHGQVPVAFVRRADPDLSAGDLRAHLDGRVADYKVPEGVEFVQEFPRTEGPHGRKIQKGELRERVADRYTEVP